MSNIHKLILRNARSHAPVSIGDIITSSKGEDYTLTGFSWSSSLASTGKVYGVPVSDPDLFAQGFYPSVFGLEIVAQNKETGEIKELWQL